MQTLSVPQIHCGSCGDFIRSVLSSLPLSTINFDYIKHSLSYSLDNQATYNHSEESLLHTVERLLDEAGYEVEKQRPSFIQRVRYLVPGYRRRKHQRHLRHCATCQAEEGKDVSNEKQEGSSLQAIEVHQPGPAELQEIKLSIEGMTCSSCSGTITSRLNSLPGVTGVSVNLVLNSAVIVHDVNSTSVETLISEIEDLGYGASLIETRPFEEKAVLRKLVCGIEGMTCSSCSTTISTAVNDLPSITAVNVSLIGNSMEVIYDPSSTSSTDIVRAVEDCGYGAVEWENSDVGSPAKSQSLQRVVQIIVNPNDSASNWPEQMNLHFRSLQLISFTPFTNSTRLSVVTYAPSPSLTIRHILALPPSIAAFASIYTPPSLVSRSREVQERETHHLERLWILSFIGAIPTFIIGVVGMSLLPKKNAFRIWCDTRIWGGATRSVIALWVLATVVQFGVGRVFYQRAWKATATHSRGPWRFSRLIHFGNMDLLVALSTTVAYFASFGIMVRDITRPPMNEETMSGTYFDSCVFLIFFILIGRILEGRAKVKTGDAISMLGSIRPETALLVSSADDDESTDDSNTVSVRTTATSIYHIDLGDRILIQPGSVPPADGIIISGTTTFDESSLTGEFLPVTKGVDDVVMTGTTNLIAPIVVRVTSVGDETMLQKIVRAVSDGQNRKAPIERLADTITSVFIPIIVWLSLIILIIWLSIALSGAMPDSYLPFDHTSNGDRVFFAFEFAISTLVIACPCGIGLAAPTAQAVGSGMAAKAGILAQGGGEAFQAAASVDTVVFDKTGTLTLGEAKVAESVQNTDDRVSAWLWEAVKIIEQGSSHPLAVAISKFCEDKKVAVDVRVVRSEEVAGRGVKATISLSGGKEEFDVVVGNEAFVLNDHAGFVSPDLFASSQQQVQCWRESGYSVVFIGTSSSSSPEDSPSPCTVQAFLAISDSIRPEAASTIATLHKSRREVFMLTGDNEVTARAVATSLGIPADHVKAGVLPHEKAEFIKELQGRRKMNRTWYELKAKEKRSIVAFCGDGLNDTAALAAADVGVALAHGSQVTISTASFVLLSKTSIPSSLVTLLDISRRVFNRQQMNFGWAMIYNLGLIPVAAGAFYAHNRTKLPPVWSAVAMALSSVSVVCSSLALQWGW